MSIVFPTISSYRHFGRVRFAHIARPNGQWVLEHRLIFRAWIRPKLQIPRMTTYLSHPIISFMRQLVRFVFVHPFPYQLTGPQKKIIISLLHMMFPMSISRSMLCLRSPHIHPHLLWTLRRKTPVCYLLPSVNSSWTLNFFIPVRPYQRNSEMFSSLSSTLSFQMESTLPVLNNGKKS